MLSLLELSFEELSFDELSLARNSPSTNFLSTSFPSTNPPTSDFSSFFESLLPPSEDGRVGLVRVVGDVPARSFELHGGRGNHLLNLAAALRALLDHLVGELLDFLEAVTALLALVFVKRHGF